MIDTDINLDLTSIPICKTVFIPEGTKLLVHASFRNDAFSYTRTMDDVYNLEDFEKVLRKYISKMTDAPRGFLRYQSIVGKTFE